MLTTFFLTIVLLSVGMSTDIVPTDARPTDASSTHDPTKIEQSTDGEKTLAICELRTSSSIIHYIGKATCYIDWQYTNTKVFYNLLYCYDVRL